MPTFIDYDKEKSIILFSKLPEPSERYSRAVIVIPQKVQEKIYYILYNSKVAQILFPCLITEKTIVKIILNFLREKINSRWIWVSFPLRFSFTDCLSIFVNIGFSSPFILNKDPFGKKGEHCVVLLLGNNEYDSGHKSGYRSPRETLLNVKYILQQYKGFGCYLFFRFSKRATSFLKKTPYQGEKEFSGELYVEKIERMVPSGTVFVMGIDETKINHEKKEKKKNK